jgi:polyferredoxin
MANFITQNRCQGLLTLVRIVLEASAAFCITAYVLNYGAHLCRVGEWLASLQLVPAALSLSLATLAVWLLITLIFGRIYCSTICPMGALIDLFGRMRSRQRHYSFRNDFLHLGPIMIIICAVLFFLDSDFGTRWLEPYGLYVNICGALTGRKFTLAICVCILLVLYIAAYSIIFGRATCHNFCPVGWVLSKLSHRTLLHIEINTDMCTHCGQCEDVCKGLCINHKEGIVDNHHCVRCFNCLPVCPNEAISYRISRHSLSDPLMQPISTMNIPPKDLKTKICDNTSTCSKTSSPTE